MSRFPALLLALGLLCADQARAELYCVATPAQLTNAVAAAQGGGASEIRVRTGFYAFSGTETNAGIAIADTTDLIVSGGWNAGCTAVTATSPDQTALSAQGSGRLLNILFPDGSSHAVSFSMLSFRSGVAASFATAGCVTAESQAGSGAELSFDLVSFRLCTGPESGGAAAMRVDLDGMVFRMRGSLVVDNAFGSNAVFLRGLGNTTFTVTNNTIANNATTSAGLLLSALPGDFFRLTNNVGWRNGRSDLQLDLFVEASVIGVFSSNLFGVTNSIPAGVVQSAALTGDPGFVSVADVRPRANSPLRNSGSNAPVGGNNSVDFLLAPRLQGGRIDRGAHEFDEFFASGFE